MERLLKRLEAATVLSVSLPTLDKLRRDGVLTCVYVGPRNPRFPESSIKSYIESNTLKGKDA